MIGDRTWAGRGRGWRRFLGLAWGLVALAGAAGCPFTPPREATPGPPEPPPRPVPRPAPSADRSQVYLETASSQMQRLRRAIGRLGPERDAAGALVAAALAARGRGGGEEVAPFARALLDECSGRWHRVHCERAEPVLQRLLLDFPGVVPGELRDRLRREAATAAPPPTAAEIAAPWGFAETENQRVLKIARSLVGHVVAGTAESPEAGAWSAYARAFLEAHDRDGWYEADSPGYLAISIGGLLHLADFAPEPDVRALAARQLDLLFAAWAQEQVEGYPAGAKSRTYVHWALSADNVPWRAWAWWLTGRGDPARLNLRDWPELALARYRVPAVVAELVAERSRQPPYEILERREIHPSRRSDVDAALYAYATPDYILGASQAVSGLRLRVSGGEEIAVTLLPEGVPFSPLYLWSRTGGERGRWGSWAEEDLAVADRNRALALLGRTHGAGHAYLAAGWGRPRVVGDLAAAENGGTLVALVTAGGWDAAPAAARFPAYYGGKAYAGSWVLVAHRQPAAIGLVVGRRSEVGGIEAWLGKLRGARLEVSDEALRLIVPGEAPFDFVPGERAAVGERKLSPSTYPQLEAPFLTSPGGGRWSFRFGRNRLRLGAIP